MMTIAEALRPNNGAVSREKKPGVLRACSMKRMITSCRARFPVELRLGTRHVAVLPDFRARNPLAPEIGNCCTWAIFRAQTRRTFNNITALLLSGKEKSEDTVRTTCYLRDIERDYAAFLTRRGPPSSGAEP